MTYLTDKIDAQTPKPNNPYDNPIVKDFNYKLGHLGEKIVREEINSFTGYSTLKSEYSCPDYKIFINGKLAGFAEVKVQSARDIFNDGRKIGYSFPAKTIENYCKFDTPETPLEFYVVDPSAGIVRWNYFSELEKTRDIDGREVPFDIYAKIFNGDSHNWHIEQFRYHFPIKDKLIAELLDIIAERDQFIYELRHNEIDTLREQRMSAY